ncbi:hypothetical protein chiPu_0015519 [Chiloscyllium punctatum]|uniref:Uncharacterized protein n=1 Tax=Chiloscyllium punctatum TaxID=137246 RepID=A0A401T2Y0_CHIPU|nr:hypothetical protein [Chiloscyllium punctatum]
MDFSGRYELQSQENVELFMDVLGVPDDMIEKIKDLKRVTKIVQNGEDFIVAIQTGDEVLVNNFTLGQETHVQTPAGDKIKTITFGDVVYKQISKKVEEPDSEEDHL